MKSKRAAAASSEDVRPVDVPQEQASKKRKRSDDDADLSKDATAGKGDKRPKKYKEERKEKKKEKKEKKKRGKEERKANLPKRDKSKYNNKTRKEKKEKLKDLQNLPEGMDVDGDEGSAQAVEAVTKPEAAVAEVEPKTNGKSEDKASKKQEKKEKKDKQKDKKEKKEKAGKDEASSSPKESVPQGEDAIDLDSSAAQKPGRNIVFVGNLPYSATAASITAHFATLKPVAVRCLTKKEDPKACRGIAFVEFATSTHQRTCLDKFHHSTFDDGVSPPRKINIELTAGGGGKGQGRQDKIMEKNKKLDENRAKRIEKEKTVKVENQASNGSARMDIHPSRLALLPGLGH